LHARAILGLPIPNIELHRASASSVLLVAGDSNQMQFGNLSAALARPNTQIRLFGKPEVSGKRRLGVALARADDVNTARDIANAIIADIKVTL
jgi:phosphoribosylglycinamide formyltransferase 2